MVSLSRSSNTNIGGATFFSESTNMNEDLQPILETYGRFKPLKTISLFSWHTLAAITIEIAAIVITVKHPDVEFKCTEYFALIYAHVIYWFLTLIMDQIVQVRHYGMRMNGYLNFYKKLQLHQRLPLYIVSLWNGAILVLQGVMQQNYEDTFVEKCLDVGILSPISYFLALMSLETCIILGINIDYIIKVRRFNKQQSSPDVQNEDWSTSNEHSFVPTSMGQHDKGERALDFIEKQADMIRHLKDHNEKLSQRLMVVTAQLQARNQS